MYNLSLPLPNPLFFFRFRSQLSFIIRYVAFALNATGAAAYSICQKPLIESGFKAIFLTAFAMTSAFLPMTVLVVYTIIHDSSRYNDFIPESRQIIALFYCAIGISVVGYAAISYVLS